MLGSYHGTKSRVLHGEDWDMLLSSKMGNVGYYDGHVDLARDPWPWRTVGEGHSLLTLLGQLTANLEEGQKVVSLLLEGIYAQRGIPFGTQQLIDLLMSSFF